MASKSVKVVAKTSDDARAQANIRESLRLYKTQFPDTPTPSKGKVVKINSNPVRTNPGVTGAGAANVGKLYRGGAGIGLLSIKNK